MYWQQWLGSVQFDAYSCGAAGLDKLRNGSTGMDGGAGVRRVELRIVMAAKNVTLRMINPA